MDRIKIGRSVVARLKDIDISITAVLRRAKLPADLFLQEHISLELGQWMALWSAFAEQSADPTIGLQISRLLQNEPYDPLWITALSADSFYTALGKIRRYKQLFSAEEITFVQQDTQWLIGVVCTAPQYSLPPILIDATFAHLLELGQRGTGRSIYPVQVLLRREEAYRSVYETHFQCPIEFSAAFDGMIFSDEAIQLPFVSANADLLALIEPQLEANLLTQHVPQNFVDQVVLLLRKRIAGATPTMQELARELYMSPRTFQRRLAGEGVHFQHLLESTRHAMAKEYLRAESLELNEIAFLLGYQEASSFHRAFFQWEGRTPGQWRATQ